MAKEITYEIIREIGVIATQTSGWTRELNLISSNGGAAKYDLRDWAPDHEKMGKGITLTEDDLRALGELIDSEVK